MTPTTRTVILAVLPSVSRLRVVQVGDTATVRGYLGRAR